MFSRNTHKFKRCLQVINTHRVIQASNFHLEEVINLSAYPIHQPESEKYQNLVRYHQDQLKINGVTTLPELITKEAITEAAKEVEEKAHMSYTMQTDHNIYLRKTDINKTISHISNKRLDTKVAALACDTLAEEGPLKVVFKSNFFLKFVQQILNRPSFYRNIDPVGAVFFNIYNDGYSHNWHFDESNWSTTIIPQEAEVGGDFQYTKPFRNEEDESQIYEIASKVIAGDAEHLKTLDLKPGTLNIFQGRRSLHSVTQCSGPVSRLLGVLHFSEKEGVRNSPGVQEEGGRWFKIRSVKSFQLHE